MRTPQITQEQEEYLDNLEKNPSDSLFGATLSLMQEFSLDHRESQEILREWSRKRDWARN